MSVLEAGAKAAAATTVIAVPAAMTAHDVVLLVVLPLLAAWIALAGIGVYEQQPWRAILRQFVSSVMLGGVAGLVALAAIDMLAIRGFGAALVSLSAGMGALTLARHMRGAGGIFYDALLNAMGLQRRGSSNDKE